MFTITLGHLLERGVRFQRYEALAIARDLIARRQGVPTIDNVQLGSDGSATCINPRGTLQVSDVAALLQALLPTTPGQVPAPLRYTLARGLAAVEAPPFESLDAFSESLARFEAGDRHGAIRSLLQRVADVPPVKPRRVVVSTAAEPAVVTARPTAPPTARASTPPPARPAISAPPVAAAAAVHAPAPAAAVHAPAPAAAVHAPASAAAVHAPAPASAVHGPAPGSARPLFSSSSPPVSQPINWGVALLAIAASFIIGAVGSQRVVWQSTPPSDGDRAVATSGTTAAAPPAPVAPAAVPSSEQNPAPRHDAPSNAPAGLIGTVTRSAYSPAFAPNGSAMFFHTGGARDATSAIAMTRAADRSGGAPPVVTVVNDGARNYHPQPSPDGRLIAFDSDRDGVRGVYIANADGTQVRRISPDGYAAAPTWSPDGKRLAYIRAERGNPRVWNLWVQSRDERLPRRVTEYAHGQTWTASWFPDNRRICYTHEDKVVVRDLTTGQARQFGSPIAGRVVRTPAVSPDGSKVVFQVFRNGAWLLDLGSGSMRRILSDPTAEEFAWAPGGDRIAFHTLRGGQWGIHIIAAG